MKHRSIDTLAVHAGTPEPRIGGAVVTPIFQSANFLQKDPESYEAVTYARLSNTPTHEALFARLAALEGAEAALALASGMAAVSCALLSVLSAGDHLLIQRNVYGGTRTFLDHEAPRFGITHTRVDPTRPETWEAALRPNTRLFYVEGISNPLLEVTDLPAVVAFARRHGLVTVIDNTFLSPVNYRPIAHGFDLVVHSATKYLNGHSDLVAGVIAGSRARVDRAQALANHLGGSLDAHACFLLDRGIKTIGLRVRHQQETALKLATALRGHPAITSVRYPGLPEDPGHARTGDFAGCGGILSFTLGDPASVRKFLDGLTLFVHAASLGGVESLVVQPARSTHLGLTQAERDEDGIPDSLIRISTGIEDAQDLLDDLLGALDRLAT